MSASAPASGVGVSVGCEEGIPHLEDAHEVGLATLEEIPGGLALLTKLFQPIVRFHGLIISFRRAILAGC
jgi:hypothetical protein